MLVEIFLIVCFFEIKRYIFSYTYDLCSRVGDKKISTWPISRNKTTFFGLMLIFVCICMKHSQHQQIRKNDSKSIFTKNRRASWISRRRLKILKCSISLARLGECSKSKFTPLNGNTSKGCILEADLEYLKELRELHNHYPLAPDKIEIKREMLSKYQLKIADLCNTLVGNVKKLVPNFFDK